MRIKKILAAALTSIAILGASIPCYAANGSSQTANTDGSLSCTVSAVVQSSYSVSLPATLSLVYNDTSHLFENTYTVGAKGNIAGNQHVSIVPASTFTMTGQISGLTATANVTQDVTKWVNKVPATGEIAIGTSAYSESTGSVSVDLPAQADNYGGTFSFTYSLVTE